MAKCIKKGDVINRVSNENAFALVKKGWEFCPRSEWKLKVRDSKKGEKGEKGEI